MNIMNKNTLDETSRVLDAMIKRVEDTKTKFKPGTAQYSLQRNRLDALNLSLVLVHGTQNNDESSKQYSLEDLKKAVAPIESLISKSEKARTKLAPGSWQYTMLSENLQALSVVSPLLQKAIENYEGNKQNHATFI